MFKVIVAGSRGFNDYELLRRKLIHFLSRYNPSDIEIVSGGANGADKLGEKFAIEKEGTQYLVDKFGYDTKQALHAYRILNFIVRFAQTDFQDFKWAMTYTKHDIDFMLAIKNGEFSSLRFVDYVSWYHETNFQPLKKKYHSFSANEELKSELELLIMELVKENL